MLAKLTLPFTEVFGIVFFGVDDRHARRTAETEDLHLRPVHLPQRPRAVDHKDHPGAFHHRPQQFAVVVKIGIVFMGRDKGGDHLLLRPLIPLEPGQGLAGILKTGGIDETNDLPAIYAHRKSLAYDGLAGDGADADRIVLRQGGKDRGFALVGMADYGEFSGSRFHGTIRG